MNPFKRKKPLPTDLQVLEAIYDRYYDTFADYREGAPDAIGRESKVYVPIDIAAVARDLMWTAMLCLGGCTTTLRTSTGTETTMMSAFHSSLWQPARTIGTA